MTHAADFTELARRLLDAVAASDWRAVARVDRDIAAALPALATARPWRAGERAMLSALRAAHQAARTHCDGEAARLSEQLDDMRLHKEGRIAYALADSAASDGARP